MNHFKLLLLAIFLMGCGSPKCPPSRSPTTEEARSHEDMAVCIEQDGPAPDVFTPLGFDCGRGPQDWCVRYEGNVNRGHYREECNVAVWSSTQPDDRALRIYRHESLHSLIGDPEHRSEAWCRCVGECQ